MSKRKAEKTKRRISPLALILAAATLIGGIAALLALLPRVTVNVSDPVDSGNPFSASATITNTGYIPLLATTPSIAINLILPQSGVGVRGAPGGPPYASRLRTPEWIPRDLGLDDKFTIALNEFDVPIYPKELYYADVAIVVEYRLPIIHLKREKLFPLIARKQTNGRFYWYSKTVD